MTGTLQGIAEELVDGFRKMWAEHDHSTYNREKLNSFLKVLSEDGIICFSRDRQGSYVIRFKVNGDIVFLSDRGEVKFLNLDFARAVKNLLGPDHQVLQIIE